LNDIFWVSLNLEAHPLFFVQSQTILMSTLSATEFIQLVTTGQVDKVQHQLSEHPELATSRDEAGRSAVLLALYYRQPAVATLIKNHLSALDLFEAAALGEIDALQQALKETAVNQPGKDGFPALGLACYLGQYEASRILLEAGADANQAASNPSRITPLHAAMARQDLELVKLLLAHGADANAAQGNGVTPLHSAAHSGQLELARVLVEAGATINARMDDGRTPLDFAKQGGFAEIVELLQKKIEG
jgi:ankyrin repeat protein